MIAFDAAMAIVGTFSDSAIGRRATASADELGPTTPITSSSVASSRSVLTAAPSSLVVSTVVNLTSWP
jgi:hypothetical protein